MQTSLVMSGRSGTRSDNGRSRYEVMGAAIRNGLGHPLHVAQITERIARDNEHFAGGREVWGEQRPGEYRGRD